MFTFQETSFAMLAVWRNIYLDSIKLSQDMYSESLISYAKNNRQFLIKHNKSEVGYFILTANNELIEFYLSHEILIHKEKIFQKLINQFEIKLGYCKSFDQVLLNCCHQFCQSSNIFGYLFNDYDTQNHYPLDEKINVRLAEMEDIPFLLSFENELLEDENEIHTFVGNKNVFLFMHGKDLLGCGYLFQVISGRNYYDMGMWVNKEFRKQGYASQIISYLKDFCIQKRHTPTAGCAADNFASRRTLERNGLASKYCLLEFHF